MTQVTDGYFEALGIPVKRGRTFTTRDAPGTPLVTVINEAAAKRYFPEEDPIGRRVKGGGVDADGPWVEIVGVVGSIRNRGLEQAPQPELFANIRQIERWPNQLFLLIKTERDPRGILAAVQAEVRSLDPDQLVYAVQTVDEVFTALAAPRHIGTMALLFFALFAMGLAAAGIYSVVSYGVGERTREIGVRLALGAPSGAVRQLVIRQAMTPVVIGEIVGLGLALALAKVVGGFNLLVGVSALDPVTFGSMALLLLVVAVAASYFPARRASRLNPTVALRYE